MAKSKKSARKSAPKAKRPSRGRSVRVITEFPVAPKPSKARALVCTDKAMGNDCAVCDPLVPLKLDRPGFLGTPKKQPARNRIAVQVSTSDRLKGLADATGKSTAEILEIAVGRLLPSDLMQPTLFSRALDWLR